MKRVGVYYRPSVAFFVHAMGESNVGRIVQEPFRRVEHDAADAELGRTVQEVFEESGRAVPVPSSWKAIQRPLLQFINVRNNSDLEKKCVYANIGRDDAGYLIAPTYKQPGNPGFSFDPAKEIRMDIGASAHSLGRMIRKVLSLLAEDEAREEKGT